MFVRIKRYFLLVYERFCWKPDFSVIVEIESGTYCPKVIFNFLHKRLIELRLCPLILIAPCTAGLNPLINLTDTGAKYSPQNGSKSGPISALNLHYHIISEASQYAMRNFQLTTLCPKNDRDMPYVQEMYQCKADSRPKIQGTTLTVD